MPVTGADADDLERCVQNRRGGENHEFIPTVAVGDSGIGSMTPIYKALVCGEGIGTAPCSDCHGAVVRARAHSASRAVVGARAHSASGAVVRARAHSASH